MRVKGYFAASNSGRGFCSYYPRVFGGADRIFVVLGGPGTGKSRFIGDVAAAAAEAGWEREYYCCSSDPDSLDGVILRRGGSSVAVIDGTAPHVWTPRAPGMCEELVDLGSFWNGAALRGRRAELERLNEKKAEGWRCAYNWLEGCEEMCGVMRGGGAELVDREAVAVQADAVMAGVAPGDGFAVRTALIGSVGMKGVAYSEGFFDRSSRKYAVLDSFMTADLLMRAVIKRSRERGVAVVVSYDPIDPRRINGVLCERGDFAVVATDEPRFSCGEHIHMSELCRRSDGHGQDSLCRARRCYDSMLCGAVDALAQVGQLHFEAERAYSAAMDFSAKERFTAQFISRLFGGEFDN